jgi:hypothetical protein
MLPIARPITGRVYSILLAPLTAHVVVQVNDNFLETFIPRSEAEKLRVGNEVLASPAAEGTKIRPYA